MRRLFLSAMFVPPLCAGLLAWRLWRRDPPARELGALPHVEGLTESEADAFRLKAEALAEAG